MQDAAVASLSHKVVDYRARKNYVERYLPWKIADVAFVEVIFETRGLALSSANANNAKHILRWKGEKKRNDVLS